MLQGFAEKSQGSYAAIVEQYGNPANIARQLQETASSEETHAVKVGARIRLIAVLAAAALLLGGLFAWYVHMRDETDPVYYDSTIIDSEELPPDFEQIIREQTN